MEKAFVVGKMSDLEFIPKDCHRVYVGNDFCPRLLPTLEELDLMIDRVKEKKLKITLLTPWSGEESLNGIKKIIDWMVKRRILRELVVNDIGVMNYAARKYPDVQIILGRAMFIMGSQNRLIRKFKIKRIETGCFIKIECSRNLKFSLYDKNYLSVSRYCPIAQIGNKKNNSGITECSKECLTFGPIEVKSFLIKEPLVLQGNILLRKKECNSVPMKEIDRIIFSKPT